MTRAVAAASSSQARSLPPKANYTQQPPAKKPSEGFETGYVIKSRNLRPGWEKR